LTHRPTPAPRRLGVPPRRRVGGPRRLGAGVGRCVRTGHSSTVGIISQITPPTGSRPKIMIGPALKSMRPHQWVKNLFVAAPLVFARLVGDSHAAWRTACAFAA